MEVLVGELMDWLFGVSGFSPHGYCLIWRPELIWMHAISDVVIAASYFAIPLLILMALRIRPGLVPQPVALLFCGFIVTCGITHIFGLITLWFPIYGIAGVAKAACALVSVVTAGFLIANFKKVRDIPSVAELTALNRQLAEEIAKKERAEEELTRLAHTLEERVVERTQQLEAAAIREREMRGEMERSLRMRDHFLAGVSHDLKTPLNAILGFSEALKMRLFGDKLEGKNAEYLDMIHEAGSSLRDFVNRLVELYRLSSSKRPLSVAHFNLAEVVQAAAAQQRLMIEERGLELKVDVAEDVPFMGDENLCHRLVQNLLSNAVSYTREGSVSVSARRLSNGVELKVTDTGIGISAEDRQSIFEVFHRGVNSEVATGGHGLGLSIVQSIVRSHHGDVEVMSNLGQGSTFVVRLQDGPYPEPVPEPLPAVDQLSLFDLTARRSQAVRGAEGRA